MTPFSKRHEQAIRDGRLSVHLSDPVRNKLIYCMGNHDWLVARFSLHGYREDVSAFHDCLTQWLLETYGETHLQVRVGDMSQVTDAIEEFIQGAKPEQVLDAVELYAASFVDADRKLEFSRECNENFRSERSPFRILEGHIVTLDSEFLESEVLARAHELLRDRRFEKASTDFLNARDNLTAGDYPGAVVAANNALESTLKKLLAKPKGEQGELKRCLMKSGLIPQYFQGFCDYFEGLLQSAFTIANQSVRHGKEEPHKERNQVDYPVASFHLHLVGSLIVFIMERYEHDSADEDIPF